MVQFEDDRRETRRGLFAKGERANNRAGWFSRLFGNRREALIGVLVLLFTAGIGGLVVRDAILSTSKDKSGLRRIIAKKWNERTLAFPIDGTDSAGRYALFDVVVLTKNYGWIKGSTTELELCLCNRNAAACPILRFSCKGRASEASSRATTSRCGHERSAASQCVT